MGTPKYYKLTSDQARIAEDELRALVFALSVDSQWAIRECCYLIELLGMPRRVLRAEQFRELEARLAIYREKTGFGRAWTDRQLNQAFYSQSCRLRRPIPKPVSKAEAVAYGTSQFTKAIPADIRRLSINTAAAARRSKKTRKPAE